MRIDLGPYRKPSFLVLRGYCAEFSYSRGWDYSTWEMIYETQAISTTRWFRGFTQRMFFANGFCKWRWISTWNPNNTNVQCKSFPFLCSFHLFFYHGIAHELGSCPYWSYQVLVSNPVFVIPPNITPLPQLSTPILVFAINTTLVVLNIFKFDHQPT